jgi:riboflavin transporter FmnP
MAMKVNKTQYLTKVGLLTAVSVILMFFEVPVPMMPVFLKLDISELPAVIGAFMLGPVAGILIELIKNLIHAMHSQTVGIGELANFLVGVALLLPASWLYRKNTSYAGAVVALTVGTVSMALVASVLNYFVLIPLYQMVIHFPQEKMISLGTAANPRITDLVSFITLAIAPFNVLKGMVVSLFTMLLYKKLLPILQER